MSSVNRAHAGDRAITSGQGVLLPEATSKKRKERTITVAVNSRDRNFTTSPNSNEFRWRFPRPLKDVVSVELVSGSIPADIYTINTGYNTFTFGETGGSIWQISLTPGHYNATELAAELQTQLNALSGKINTYTVTYTSITRRSLITATGGAPFTFYLFSGDHIDTYDSNTGAIESIKCPGRLFGFEYADYTSSAGSLSPPNRMDPYLLSQRLYLHINADNSVEFNRIEVGAGRKDCFHILYLDQITNGYYTLNKDTYTPLFYSAPAPISRITTLNISFRDEFYRLLDLGNHDSTLVFDITFIE
jgi:hypothetical protein